MSCQILTKEERNLMQAVHEGDLKAATKLIREDRVAVNIQDCLMRTPLLRTCYLQSQYTRCALAKLLLKNGATINTTDKHGRTALMTACMETDREDLVKIMLNAKGVDANARDETGSTALMHAVRTDNVESVRTLVTWKPPPGLSRQVSVDLGDFEGMYPLLLAANQQNPDICEILVKDGEAQYGDIPTLLKKYLPPECRGGKRKPITNDPFEKYRHQAQDILNTPYRPPMMLAIDPESLPDIDDDSAGHANDSPERKPDNNDQEPEETDNALKHAPDHWYPWMSAMSVTRLNKITGDKNQSENDNDTEVDNASSKEVGLNRSDTFVKVPRKEPETSDSKPPPKSPPKSREAWTEKNKDSEKKENEEKRLQEEDRKQEEKERKLEEEEKMRKEEDRKQREKEKRREEEEKRQEEDRKQKEKEKRREEEEKRQEEDRKQKEKEKRREEEEKRQEEEERKQKEKERKREEDRKQEERDRESKQTDDKPKREREPADNAKPKDPKRQEDKPEYKDKYDKASKESKEAKPKGQWIDEPKEEVEEEPPLAPPPPPMSSKKKKKGGAYKTKAGRVIHPNVHNDPQYKNIMDAKKGGDQTGNPGSKGKQTGSKLANKSGTRSGTSGQQKRHGGQGRR